MTGSVGRIFVLSYGQTKDQQWDVKNYVPFVIINVNKCVGRHGWVWSSLVHTSTVAWSPLQLQLTKSCMDLSLSIPLPLHCLALHVCVCAMCCSPPGRCYYSTHTHTYIVIYVWGLLLRYAGVYGVRLIKGI